MGREWGIQKTEVFYMINCPTVWLVSADLSSFQLNRPLATKMSETYKKLTQTYSWEQVNATEPMLRFWSLRRQNTKVPSNPCGPPWCANCVLGGNIQWGHLLTTGASQTAVNRAKPNCASLQSCSATGSLSQGRACISKEQDGALHAWTTSPEPLG